MDTTVERILLVESDPDISDLIAHQMLQPLGYQVNVVCDADNAIRQALQFTPDLVITNLSLPGLSGKDLVTALNSQGIKVPVIVIAEKGNEYNVIQAFRLGAMDYFLWSARETEVVAAVERALKQVRESRIRQQLEQQVAEANQELQRQARALTTIFAIGKEVVSATDQRVLFNKIVGGAVYAAQADYGWFLLRDEQTKAFLLTAHRNLPGAWSQKINQPFYDGISSLVIFSGEPLAINGEPLQGFMVAQLGQSVAVVPVKIQQEVVGLLVVVRKANRPFERDVQALLGAIADYVAITLINANLSRRLRETTDAAQADEKRKNERLQVLQQEMQNHLQLITYPIELLLTGKMGFLTEEQQLALSTMQTAVRHILQMVSAERTSEPVASPKG